MTTLYHLEQTELAQVWRGGTAPAEQPRDTGTKCKCLYGVKDRGGTTPVQRSSTWGRERSDPGDPSGGALVRQGDGLATSGASRGPRLWTHCADETID